ncbi:MAG: VOC family protein [Gammaproteobacteria bacterium]|jgi:extradiol dioxygenase family protein|nr:VOC family protein [Gammaproteobacteria bacterium]
MSAMRPFHLAIPVRDLASSKHFYADLLGCSVGRQSPHWIDFNFFGHQLTAHLADDQRAATNDVDGKQVPVRHFGMVLEWQQWHDLADRLRQVEVQWLIEPGIRFAGQTGEQATFFISDPSGNALEFKAFKNDTGIFAHDD